MGSHLSKRRSHEQPLRIDPPPAPRAVRVPPPAPTEVKILVVGSPGVGKKSLIQSFYPEGGVLEPGNRVVVPKNFGTAGERMVVMLSPAEDGFLRQHIQEARAYIIVFALDDRDSAADAERLLGKLIGITGSSPRALPAVLVGNKSDTLDRSVSKIEARAMASRNHSRLFETSAKNGFNIDEPFAYVAGRYSEHADFPVSVGINVKHARGKKVSSQEEEVEAEEISRERGESE